ncbi:paraneoplastic antigen-like protein 5 [Elysia marginata]|uniref:Paraneoplastic antigen-like protein 5 n=1 Tax=Elysia marginata TaxID=1093978 RepID=A0AAV4HGF1_9GAST|nr:paraneoplastic antigen-like protein 5 [Elysia marginata]
MTLGVGACVDDVLHKFKAVFEPTESAQSILSRFYGLKQGEAEDAGAFAARLEDAILQAVQLGRVRQEDVDTMLCEAFEGGLRRETKAVTSYLFASRNVFPELVVDVKRKEKELIYKGGTVASVQASEIDVLKAQVLELRTELRTLKNKRSQPDSAAESHTGSHDPPPGPRPYYSDLPMGSQAPRQRRSHPEPVCWRCNMPGHVRSGCRMPLNGTASVGRGRPQAQ